MTLTSSDVTSSPSRLHKDIVILPNMARVEIRIYKTSTPQSRSSRWQCQEQDQPEDQPSVLAQAVEPLQSEDQDPVKAFLLKLNIFQSSSKVNIVRDRVQGRARVEFSIVTRTIFWSSFSINNFPAKSAAHEARFFNFPKIKFLFGSIKSWSFQRKPKTFTNWSTCLWKLKGRSKSIEH